jgi:hypothetical protein
LRERQPDVGRRLTASACADDATIEDAGVSEVKLTLAVIGRGGRFGFFYARRGEGRL